MSKVKLLSFYGNDDFVVNAARVSFGKEASKYTDDQNEKLINYLVKHGHTSPFRHPQLSFRIKCPIYVERQLFKHQVGISVNSISGRYVDFSDSYTTIGKWRAASKDAKQGSGDALPHNIQILANEWEKQVIEFCSRTYEILIDGGVCKEQARTILPLNLNTEFVWTGSLLAFIHLIKLRTDAHAQKETTDVAVSMLDQVKGIPSSPFYKSLKAFGL